MLVSAPYQSSSNITPSRLIGQTKSVKDARRRLERFAPTQLPILISGETGAGKDFAAQDIHRLSPQHDGPYVAVNCGTLQPNLAAAELFGSKRGAFTGAVDRVGLLTQANGGTLFLDEIGDLPPPVQTMLLRALENGFFRMLGGEAPIRSQFRLVCASHVDLERACDEGTFRQDLYFRLSILQVKIPPLRHRKADLESLIDLVCPGVLGRLHHSSVSALRAYAYPGNLRELRNILTASKALYQGRWIMPEDLSLRRCKTHIDTKSTPSLAQHITEYVHRAFINHNRNIRKTARMLEVSPNTVYRYLALYGASRD